MVMALAVAAIVWLLAALERRAAARRARDLLRLRAGAPRGPCVPSCHAARARACHAAHAGDRCGVPPHVRLAGARRRLPAPPREHAAHPVRPTGSELPRGGAFAGASDGPPPTRRTGCRPPSGTPSIRVSCTRPKLVGKYVTEGLGSVIIQVLGYLPRLVLIPILAFFLLKDSTAFRAMALRTLPRGRWRSRGREVLQDISATLAVYIRAQLIACAARSARSAPSASPSSACRTPSCSGSWRASWSSSRSWGRSSSALMAALIASFVSSTQVFVVVAFLGLSAPRGGLRHLPAPHRTWHAAPSVRGDRGRSCAARSWAACLACSGDPDRRGRVSRLPPLAGTHRQ